MEKLTFIPSPALEGKYKVINTAYPILHSRIGDLDLRIITLDQADQLIKAGTRYLKAIKRVPKVQVNK